MLRSAMAILLLAVAGCAPFRSGSRFSSVERILLRSEAVGRQLDAESARSRNSVRGPTSATGPAFQWPIKKRVIPVNSGYGERDGRAHTGMDLHAPMGTPIYPALDGIVVYAGDGLSGYGRTIIVRHIGNYSTLYAHASKLYVQEGERVSRSRPIALSGRSGRVSGPHLHFELRHGTEPVNPRDIIPDGRPRPPVSAPPTPPPTAQASELDL